MFYDVFAYPKNKPQQSKIILKNFYELMKIYGDFPTITTQISYGYVRINEICEGSSITKKKMSC